MPMYNFIKLNVTGDVVWLIKSGAPIDTDSALEKINSEYAELSGDTNQAEILKAEINYKVYTNRLQIFNSIIEMLKLRRVDELIDILIEMGFKYDYTDLPVALARCVTQSKQWIVKINHALHVLEDRPKQSTPNEKAWYDSLSAIAKYRQVPAINPRNITVIEYISMEKDFTEYINYMKAQQNGR